MKIKLFDHKKEKLNQAFVFHLRRICPSLSMPTQTDIAVLCFKNSSFARDDPAEENRTCQLWEGDPTGINRERSNGFIIYESE